LRAACHPLCRQSYQRYCRQTNEHCAKTPHLGAFSCCDATSRHDGDRPHAPLGRESAGTRGASPRVVLPLATRFRRTTLPHVPLRAPHLRITPSDLRGTSAERATQPRPTRTGGERRGVCLKPYGGGGRRGNACQSRWCVVTVSPVRRLGPGTRAQGPVYSLRARRNRSGFRFSWK
jgi:hypothetical protein